jgi:prepilin-type N-terminal cleavage/methylation domain-containing protein
MKNLYNKGYTLIEVLIGLFVIGIILATVVFSFSALKKSQALKNAVSDAMSSIDKARSEAFASVSSSEYGVRFESDKVVIFKGTSYSAGTGTNETVNIVSPATISNVTLNGVSGPSGDLYFNRLTGVPSKNGTITITASSSSKIITISATGGTSVN